MQAAVKNLSKHLAKFESTVVRMCVCYMCTHSVGGASFTSQ